MKQKKKLKEVFVLMNLKPLTWPPDKPDESDRNCNVTLKKTRSMAPPLTASLYCCWKTHSRSARASSDGIGSYTCQSYHFNIITLQRCHTACVSMREAALISGPSELQARCLQVRLLSPLELHAGSPQSSCPTERAQSELSHDPPL